VEPNDTSNRPVALSGSVCGAVNGGDQDWFTWSVGDTPTPYEISVSGTGDAQILMWKLVGGQYYAVAGDSPTKIAKTSNGAGSYVIAVWSPNGANQNYALTLKK
jgi:hypothetical protein